MTKNESKDQELQIAIAAVLAGAPPTASSAECLEPEVLAAWADGGLSGPELERVHAHAATCGDCRESFLILGQSAPPEPVRNAFPWKDRLRDWAAVVARAVRPRVLAPLALAATAVLAIVQSLDLQPEAVRMFSEVPPSVRSAREPAFEAKRDGLTRTWSADSKLEGAASPFVDEKTPVGQDRDQSSAPVPKKKALEVSGGPSVRRQGRAEAVGARENVDIVPSFEELEQDDLTASRVDPSSRPAASPPAPAAVVPRGESAAQRARHERLDIPVRPTTAEEPESELRDQWRGNGSRPQPPSAPARQVPPRDAVEKERGSGMALGAGNSAAPASSGVGRQSDHALMLQDAEAASRAIAADVRARRRARRAMDAREAPAEPAALEEMTPTEEQFASSSAPQQGASSARTLGDPLAGPHFVTSPDGSTIWRVLGSGSVERRGRFERKFGTVSDVGVPVTGAVARSRVEVWVVGRSGFVARSLDGGDTWSRLSSPVDVDLVRVRMDGSEIVLTSADGRSFATPDGSHWSERSND